jgi:hypothetical protein
MNRCISRIGSCVFAMSVCAAVSAQLDITVSHTGPFGETQQFFHTPGGSTQVFDSFGFNYFVTSPVVVPGADFAMSIDFTNFAYTDFAGETGSISITGYPGFFFAVTLQNGAFQTLDVADYDGMTITADWQVSDVLSAGNTLYVAWVIPTPGGAGLIGGLGLAGLRRRR